MNSVGKRNGEAYCGSCGVSLPEGWRHASCSSCHIAAEMTLGLRHLFETAELVFVHDELTRLAAEGKIDSAAHKALMSRAREIEAWLAGTADDDWCYLNDDFVASLLARARVVVLVEKQRAESARAKSESAAKP